MARRLAARPEYLRRLLFFLCGFRERTGTETAAIRGHSLAEAFFSNRTVNINGVENSVENVKNYVETQAFPGSGRGAGAGRRAFSQKTAVHAAKLS